MVTSGWLGDYSFQSTLAGSAPPLGPAEELILARRFRETGDRSAGERLARAHLRNVVYLATKHRHYGIRISDLIAEGNCGLVDALLKFDPERGVRFGSYAKHWIRAYMFAYVIRSRVSVGGSAGLIRSQLFFKLRRERARMNSLLGEGHDADEALAKRLEISVVRLRSLLARLDCREVSLDAPPTREAPPCVPEPLVWSSDPEQVYFQDQRRGVLAAAVHDALTSLDARERFIVEKRLMAAPAEELTLAQLAEGLGVSSERVRQIEGRAMRKLKASTAIGRNQQLSDWLIDWLPVARAG
ncbi:MAG TPA: sigma-70 family RNA polymerase sigma factor [Polyangiaceae bacterium]|nr:sigma-70 family RNA polymerase sigma factor [Polyangiaceae bacterium]